jgi:hypothetical protein
MIIRPQYQTPSSARKTTLLSIPPPTYPIAAHRASKTSTLRFSPPTRRLLTTRRVRRRRLSSRTPKAQRHARPRRRRPLLLEEGEVSQRHEEEAEYLHVVVQQEAQRGEVELQEGLQEAEEGARRKAWWRAMQNTYSSRIDMKVSNISLIHYCYPTSRLSISSHSQFQVRRPSLLSLPAQVGEV